MFAQVNARRRGLFQGVMIGLLLGLANSPTIRGADREPPPGFVALFNGKDSSGWKVPEGDAGHWKVQSEENPAPGST